MRKGVKEEREMRNLGRGREEGETVNELKDLCVNEVLSKCHLFVFVFFVLNDVQSHFGCDCVIPHCLV